MSLSQDVDVKTLNGVQKKYWKKIMEESVIKHEQTKTHPLQEIPFLLQNLTLLTEMINQEK